jgi:peroxiredoxin
MPFPAVGDLAPEVPFTYQSQTVTLGAFRGGPVLLVFLRHLA